LPGGKKDCVGSNPAAINTILLCGSPTFLSEGKTFFLRLGGNQYYLFKLLEVFPYEVFPFIRYKHVWLLLESRLEGRKYGSNLLVRGRGTTRTLDFIPLLGI
jgi:hypothetical protein